MSLATITAVLALSVIPAAAAVPEPVPAGEQRTFAFVSHAGGVEEQRLAEFGDCLDVVAPNWYSLDPQTGRVGARDPDADVVAGSRRDGYELWPVINAQTGGERALLSPAGRARIAAAAGALAARHGYDGLTLDIEGIAPEQRSAFTRLVAAVAGPSAPGRPQARRLRAAPDRGAARRLRRRLRLGSALA